jgi:hypothetical protein
MKFYGPVYRDSEDKELFPCGKLEKNSSLIKYVLYKTLMQASSSCAIS